MRVMNKPALTDDWNAIRAAQHMIQVHGSNAVQVAARRAADARDPHFARRWLAIAKALHNLAPLPTP
jgi:hypothetical protein